MCPPEKIAYKTILEEAAKSSALRFEFEKSSVRRPMIWYSLGKIMHNLSPCRVVLRKDSISIGCTDVTPEAARYLLAEYDKRFPKNEEIVLQP